MRRPISVVLLAAVTVALSVLFGTALASVDSTGTVEHACPKTTDGGTTCKGSQPVQPQLGDAGALPVQSRQWGPRTVISSVVATATPDAGIGGMLAQSPTPAGCRDMLCTPSDICTLVASTSTPVAVAACSTSSSLEATGGETYQASTHCYSFPFSAVTTTPDAGASDAEVIAVRTVSGSAVVSLKRECLQ